MNKLAKFSLIITVFGQLGYLAATYYVNFPHPAYPVWAVMYLAAGTAALAYGASPGGRALDLRFAACIVWLIFSFVIAGRSEAGPFIAALGMVLVGPYLCGRLLGGSFRPRDFLMIYPLAAFLLALMFVEMARDPSMITENDRPRFFITADSSDLAGGAAFYIAALFGGAFILAITCLTFPEKVRQSARLGSKRLHQVVALVSFGVLVMWGSRASTLTASLIAVLVYFGGIRVTLSRVLGSLAVAAGLLFGIYSILPPARRELVAQVPDALANLSSVGGCNITTGGDSIIAHILMFSEAWRLFLSAPLFGVGASNFGLEWCDQKIEFASPHSWLLHILTEQGIIGLMPWLFFVGGIIRLRSASMRTLAGNDAIVARIVFLQWVFLFTAMQASGNLFTDYQFLVLSGMMVTCLTPVAVRTAAGPQRLAAAGVMVPP